MSENVQLIPFPLEVSPLLRDSKASKSFDVLSADTENDKMPPKSFIPPNGPRRYLHDTWQSSLVLILAITACTAVILHIIRSSSEKDSGGDLKCNSNNEIEEVPEGYDPLWDTGSYFSINIPVFSGLQYTQAKIIDACWDFGVGRGGQALMGIAAYRVVRQSIKLTMENNAVPISTATSICSQQQIQAMSIWELSRAAAFRQITGPWTAKAHTRMRIVACIFVCVYVLSFATISSIMTGYNSVLEVYYGEVEDGEAVLRTSSFNRADILLFDGQRLNLTTESSMIAYSRGLPPLEYEKDEISEILRKYWATCSSPPALKLSGAGHIESFRDNKTMPEGYYNWTSSDGDCECRLPPGATELSQVESYIFSRSIGSNSLGAPPLRLAVRESKDISIHQAMYRDVNGTVWLDDIWVRNGFVIDPNNFYNIKSSSHCLTDTRYSWGFSLQLLLTFAIYTFLFALALAILQVEVYWQGQWHRLNQPYSIYSDILAIASSLEAKFGSDVRDIPVRDLEGKISGHRGGIRLQTDGLPLSRRDVHEARCQAYQAGPQAGGELENLTAQPSGRASEADLTLSSATDHSDQTAIATRPRPEYGIDGVEEEERAESPLPGLESEMSRIHSRYSSNEDATLLSPGKSSELRDL